ncbi:hypothetical protein HO312_001638, partial [Campylobacter jejuni]|nr:hypothetical protein [Campylobacter coli]EFO7721886.1 hypothetical protein [Campylobacter jejuni]EGC6711851.1 hypothetical protein [Campylobacter jejuni]EGT1677954.1 hypothetical protein [Campylobacter jejuni]EJA9400906.1 hypothetical protein [Campylobacter jejuni]
MERKIYNIKRGWLFKTKRDFAKRWNIEIEDRFYERCITLIGDIINPKQLSELEQKIFLIVGEIYKGEKKFSGVISIFNHFNGLHDSYFAFHETALYSLLMQLKDVKFLEALENIINFCKKDKDDEFLLTFNDIVLMSNKPFRLYYNDKYEFHPSNIEIFDQVLINDVLEFLKDYPKAKKQLSEALKIFITKENYRDVVDKTRLSLELFLTQLLNNEKSLENQKDEILRYFGNLLDENFKKMFL